jgi:homoserine kinase
LALSLYLELQITVDESNGAQSPILSYEGVGEERVSLDPEVNLITRTALYVLKCHNQRTFPLGIHVHVKNPIPLGRGLGSSGAAVVAGVALGNEVGKLGLSKPRMLVSRSLHTYYMRMAYRTLLVGLLSHDRTASGQVSTRLLMPCNAAELTQRPA